MTRSASPAAPHRAAERRLSFSNGAVRGARHPNHVSEEIGAAILSCAPDPEVIV